jgi:hypothetical protein
LIETRERRMLWFNCCDLEFVATDGVGSIVVIVGAVLAIIATANKSSNANWKGDRPYWPIWLLIATVFLTVAGLLKVLASVGYAGCPDKPPARPRKTAPARAWTGPERTIEEYERAFRQARHHDTLSSRTRPRAGLIYS